MSVTQTISSTRLSGAHTFTFNNTQQSWTWATVTIDRTVNQGLNSDATLTLDLGIDYSPDGGTTWLGIAAVQLLGGTITTKGVTLTQDTLTVGIGQPFPVGTAFRVNTNATSPVRISGTVVYS